MANPGRGWRSVYVRAKDKKTKKTKWIIVGQMQGDAKGQRRSEKFSKSFFFTKTRAARDYSSVNDNIVPMRNKKERVAYINVGVFDPKTSRETGKRKWVKVGTVGGFGSKAKSWSMKWIKPPK